MILYKILKTIMSLFRCLLHDSLTIYTYIYNNKNSYIKTRCFKMLVYRVSFVIIRDNAF